MKKIWIIALAVLLLAVGAFAVAGLGADKKTGDMAQEVTVQEQPAAAQEAVQEGGMQDNPQQNEAPSGQEDEAEIQIYELAGEVTMLGEGYFILQDATVGEVQVNYGDDTLFEGVEPGELAVGQTALVLYDGKMTRSLPAQAYALRVGVYAVGGKVTELGEGSVTLMRDELGDEVIVFLPQGAPELAVGDEVTAYTNGAMTMSLPAQTTALSVVKK